MCRRASPLSEALTRILDYTCAFSEKIDRCRTTPFNATDWEDAYNRLNRFRERYLHGKSYLDPAEAQALGKVFEEDTFIKEMLDIRQIGEHAHKRGESAIRLMTNAPIPICVKTSALGFFNAPMVKLLDVTGQLYSINHLQNRTKAENRIQRALTRATDKQP